ncbi:MAG: hypothetical protein KF760_27050 [Candidatus Eremiobacteraeota bacterium]|nr:hypothetical protein [Candidatus Eremiobacteraeota bacterium]MCW5869602.1 hypothetical protein [Candidatus Eremiobacteraeota bacterium]
MKDEAVWDSTGRFQVDLLRRSQKIFKLQVNQPYLHLLKFLQAGVADGAEEISLQWDASSIGLKFQPRNFSCQSLHDLLHSGAIADRAVQHLGNAVMLASVAAGRGYRIRLWDGEQFLLVTPEGMSLKPSQEPRAFHLEFERPLQRWWNWKARRAADLHLHQCLRQRFQFCPTPIFGNGQLLNQGILDVVAWFPQRKRAKRSLLEIAMHDYDWLLHSLEFGPGLAFQPLIGRYQTVMPAEELLPYRFGQNTAILECPSSVYSKELTLGARCDDPWLAFRMGDSDSANDPDRVYMLKDGAVHNLPKLATDSFRGYPHAPLSIRRLSALSILPGEGCVLAGVQDGMLLNPVPLPGPPGGLVLTCAPGWQTDLGQLEPVLDDHLKHEQSQVVQHLRALLARVRGWLVDKDLMIPGKEIPKQARLEWQKAEGRAAGG